MIVSGGREPGRTGSGRGLEVREQGQEVGSIWRREAGEEIKKAIVCCLLLGIIQSKHLSSKGLKFPFNIHQCFTENKETRKQNQENVNLYSGWKNSITSGEFGNPFNRLRYRSWDSMTHDTRTAVAIENLQQRKRFRVIQGKSSKTMLTGLSIFRCGNENSVHGRPSWELAPYDCTSQITEDFASWCKLASKECRFNERAGECGAYIGEANSKRYSY